MFRSLTVRAKSVRCSDIIKIAGTKYEVRAVTTFYGNDNIEFAFATTKTGTRFSTLLVDKNAPMKIYKK